MIKVTEGCIKINELCLEVDHPNVKVIMGDLVAKRAGCAVGGSSAGVTINLFATEETLHADNDRPRTTTIEIDTDTDEHWLCLAEVARYTLYVTLWRSPADGGEVLWPQREEQD